MNKQSKGEIITILGPKNSGKTTYLAGLADWPISRTEAGKSSPFVVQPIGEHSNKKKEEVQEKILDGAYLPPTVIQSSFNDLPKYLFRIKIKQLLKEEQIFLSVRDYPGEIYNQLSKRGSLPDLAQEYIKECLKSDVSGCLILLDKWERENDLVYSQAMTRFLEEMDRENRIKGHEKRNIRPLRIAVAMSKCERGEIWPGRIEPEIDIFNQHLPGTTKLLRDRLKHNVRFFAISTFGVLNKHTDPRPNRKSERKRDSDGKDMELSVLREKYKWHPYGMIGPLYWLSKGKAMRHGV